MYSKDVKKMAFITKKSLYCYKVMPFGLKNIRTAYQQLINKFYKDQINQNMEVYVHDMLMKSNTASLHIYFEEAFNALRKHQMRLNLNICVFDITSNKFLRFMMTRWGIEINPKKIKTILDIKPPTSKRKVQKLAGHIVALRWFILRSAECCLLFFKILRHMKDFT